MRSPLQYSASKIVILNHKVGKCAVTFKMILRERCVPSPELSGRELLDLKLRMDVMRTG